MYKILHNKLPNIFLRCIPYFSVHRLSFAVTIFCHHLIFRLNFHSSIYYRRNVDALPYTIFILCITIIFNNHLTVNNN